MISWKYVAMFFIGTTAGMLLGFLMENKTLWQKTMAGLLVGIVIAFIAYLI